MPFFGQDPTGPGLNWVRTSTGWKKVADVGEQMNRHIKKFARDRIATCSKFDRHPSQPGESPSTSKNNGRDDRPDTVCESRNYLFLPTAWRSSRQHGIFLTAGDILSSFDFCSALRDHRRFSYVCKVLEIICEKHFASLSGSAVRSLFSILEEVVKIVNETQQYIRRVIKLLGTVKSEMSLNSGRLIGSRVIYNCRSHLLNLWLEQLKNIQLYEREEDGKLMLLDLPLECWERIFQTLAYPQDILHLSQTCHQLQTVGSSPILWEELFFYHFTEDQLSTVPEMDGRPDWKAGFKKLRKRTVLREEYPVMMELCCHCSCIYWQGSYHPCSRETLKEKESREMNKEIITVPLDPKDFMNITIVI